MKNKNEKCSSFLKQLRVAFIVIILIPVLGLGGIILYSSHQYIKQQRKTEVENTIMQNITALNGWITQCDIKISCGKLCCTEFFTNGCR